MFNPFPDHALSANEEIRPTPAWFALRVRPRHEKRISDGLRYLGHAVFLPQYRSTRRWSDRHKEVSFPLFPGYAFCQIEVGQHWRLVRVPGVLGIAGFGKTPVPLAPHEVAFLQSIANLGLAAAPWPGLVFGSQVRLVGGPLRGLEGRLLTTRGAHRLVVDVALLRRSVAVEIEREWIAAVRPRGVQLSDVSPACPAPLPPARETAPVIRSRLRVHGRPRSFFPASSY